MRKYFKQYSHQTEFFSKQDPVGLFMHIIEMLENNYANEIEGLNLNEQTKKEEYKLKFKMVGKSDIITDWVFEMVI
jgi:hypothetical protein